MSDVTQRDLLVAFFKNNPNRDIAYPEIVDWATAEYEKRKCHHIKSIT